MLVAFLEVLFFLSCVAVQFSSHCVSHNQLLRNISQSSLAITNTCVKAALFGL
jgi:hypothetical protein